MFEAERQHVLDKGDWGPDDGRLGYMEVWSRGTEGGVTGINHRTGFMTDGEVQAWLHLRGRFASEESKQLAAAPTSLRLVLCERYGWKPLGFYMSRESYLAIEEAFDLPAEVLPVLNTDGGCEHFNLRSWSASGGHGQQPQSVGKRTLFLMPFKY
jgi:hypothetical protein